MRIDYENPEVVARQNIAPNAGCDIDGVFYDMRNCVYLLKEQADRIEELEADLRKMALDYLAAEGQAAEAYQAQLAAEAKLAEVEAERDRQYDENVHRIVKEAEAEAKLAKAVEALKRSAEGWSNALELNIIANQHRTSAGILRDEARSVLAELKGETDE